MQRILKLCNELVDNINVIRFYFKLNKIRNINKKNIGTVIFNTVRIYPNILHYELFIAYHLANRGYKIKVLLDDGVLKHWDSIQENNFSGYYTLYNANFLKKYYLIFKSKLIILAYKHPNIDIIYYSTIIDKNLIDVDEDTYLKSNINNYVEPSVRRFFQTNKIYHNNKEHKLYKDLTISNTLLSYTLANKVNEKFKPDIFITSHAIYSTWGPMYDYMKNHNLTCIVYAPHSYIKQSYLIVDGPAQLPYNDMSWRIFKENSSLYNNDNRNLAIKFFEDRMHHNTIDTKTLYTNVNFSNIDINKRNDNSLVFGMFPNIIWDGDLNERHILFDSVVDWVVQTVKIFKNTKHHLVIRFHPAESRAWTNSVKLENILKECFPAMFMMKNITIISSSINIDTYVFLKKNIDIGLIYNGTLSTELVYLKIPVIVASKTRYMDSKFEIIPNSLNEYKNMIINHSKTISDFNANYTDRLESMLKCMYWYNYIASYHVPILDGRKAMMIDLKNIAISDINENLNLNLKRTIDKFTGKGIY